MAQFNLNWFNTAIILNPNSTNQTVGYRQKSVGGAFLVGGFTPANNLPKTASAAVSPILDNNKIWEFRVQGNCAVGGPIFNDNGIKEGLKFACIVPTLSQGVDDATILINLSSTDITKARFTLRLTSNNSIVYGPAIVNRVGNFVSTTTTDLNESTSYYWQVEFYATVNGVEIISSAANQLNSVCGPYSFTTEETPLPPDLIWIPFSTICESDSPFQAEKTITSVSTPTTSWYDNTTNRVYVADSDSPFGNVYWFNPATATTFADMNYSAALQQDTLYNSFIDGANRKIYFVGRDSGGLIVYDIDTDSISIVPFGTDGINFSRTALFVLNNRIYCDFNGTNIIIIDRTTLTVINNIITTTIPTHQHFSTGPFNMVQRGSRIYVASNNSDLATIGMYNEDLTTNFGEITLTGATAWTFGNYWQNIFYDLTSDKIFVSDAGSSRRFVIDPTTNTVVDNRVQGNKGGKSNAFFKWSINPLKNEIYCALQALNNATDTSPVIRTYIQDRTTYNFTKLFVDQYFSNLSIIDGTDTVSSTFGGASFWSGAPNYDTDGVINILAIGSSGGLTGTKITTILQEVDANDGNAPTGNYKPNVIGDTDYVSPVEDLTACPVTVNTDCPVEFTTTFAAGSLEYEFAIPNSVKNNPSIVTIQVFAYDTDATATEGSAVVISPVNDNYYSGTIAGLANTNYTIQVRYLDGAATVLATCTLIP